MALLLIGSCIANATENRVLFSESFASSKGEFIILDTNLPNNLTYIWKHDSKYGMCAGAYVNSKAYESESWLISPTISLKRCTSAYAAYEHAAKFQNGAENRGITIWAAINPRTDSIIIDEWTQLVVPTYPTKGTWNFYPTGQISLHAFAGQENIRIAIRYNSTTQAADTYEMKNFSVTGIIGETFTVTAVSADQAQGSVNGGGIYAEGTTTTLTANPNVGYNFSQWNDGNTSATRTITVNVDATYIAYFTPSEDISISQAKTIGANLPLVNSYGNIPGSLLTSNPSGNSYYISGWVSDVSIDTTNLSATYNITDNTSTIKVYRGKALDGAAFRFYGQIQEGDYVRVIAKIQELAWASESDINGNILSYNYETELVNCHIVYQDNQYINAGGLVYRIAPDNKVSVTNSFNLSTEVIVKDHIEFDGDSYSVTEISDGALQGMNFTKLYIPSTITSIGENALSGCSSLTTVVSSSAVPPLAHTSTFTGISNFDCTLYVPQSSILDYNQAEGWSTFLFVESIENAEWPVEEDNTTSIDFIPKNDSITSYKILCNGQIYLLRGDNIYTLTGQEIIVP